MRKLAEDVRYGSVSDRRLAARSGHATGRSEAAWHVQPSLLEIGFMA